MVVTIGFGDHEQTMYVIPEVVPAMIPDAPSQKMYVLFVKLVAVVLTALASK